MTYPEIHKGEIDFCFSFLKFTFVARVDRMTSMK